MEELESSLDMYELQLGQVKQALEADKNNADLMKLNDDLQQLITLTTQNILEEKKKALLAHVQEIEEEQGIELHPVPEAPQEKSDEDSVPRQRERGADEPPPREPLDLGQLDGMKCKAPYHSRASLNSMSMHNAMIFQTEPGADSAVSLDHVLVRVVFSHPTSTGMVPCPYYLDGRCRFSDGDCKFSHGEVARLSELGEFEEPNFDLLKTGCAVIAKDGEGGQVWDHAKVEGVEGDLVHVRFTSDHKEIKTVAKEAVFPLSGEDGDDEDNLDVLEADVDDDESLFVPVDLLDRLNPEADKLGDWEQHTRGIASRLMQKMGYVVGTGLGKDPSSSRVLPVTATIYPQGKSLDWCMELRERAGGGDILSVEKTLRRQQAKEEKKTERRMVREKEREKRQNKTFDFINQLTGIGGGQGASETSASTSPSSSSSSAKFAVRKRPPTAQPFHSKKKDSKSDSAKSLNVRSLQIGEEIRRTEREMASLRKTYERRKTCEPAMAASVKKRIEEKERLLRDLRGREGKLNRDKTMSDSKKKLRIF